MGKSNGHRKKARDVMTPAEQLPLTDECKRYESSWDMPQELSKYWAQRHDLFTLYDDHDIYMTDNAWFGVTAEPIANEIANELHRKHQSRPTTPSRRTIIDLFAGAGGNTIAFARANIWTHVIGIEIDAATLACAQHNARVYGVADRITWIHGDCTEFLRRLRHQPAALDPQLRGLLLDDDDDIEIELFASPPWGGPLYSGAEVMDLEAMEPYGVGVLHHLCSPWAHALFLPRNGDLRQLAALVPDGASEKLDVVQYCINGGSKGMVAYYPAEDP